MSMEAWVADAVRRALREEDGSILVFLPGVGEIRKVEALLQGVRSDTVHLCPLYGDLPAAEQDAAIAPVQAPLRKIVLATSIAETSLTIEGVRVVIDSGLARTVRFDAGTGMSRLVTERVSLASAEQRRAAGGADGAWRVLPAVAPRGRSGNGGSYATGNTGCRHGPAVP